MPGPTLKPDEVRDTKIPEAYGLDLVGLIVLDAVKNYFRLASHPDADDLRRIQAFLDGQLIRLWNDQKLWRDDLRFVVVSKPGEILRFEWQHDRLPESVDWR